MYILETKSLSKKFGDFVAVDNVSIQLKEGEILGILGPNGAGKTTTIQMLLGILTPSAGEVYYFGKKLKNQRTEIMEQIGFSSTYTNLPWYLTVKENLTWISHMFLIKDRKQRVREIIKLFKMEDIEKKIMADLSAGQLTKVNMAKAFINYPKILLLDEPTASLDVEIAKYIRNLVLKERKEYKVSVIITSHNMAEVEELCDRVIVINNGKIIANDTPAALIKSIKICRVELFIEKNLKKVTSYCASEKLKYEIDGKSIYISLESSKIPSLLQNLNKSNVSYSEISIERPSLEDYFLQVIGKGTNHEIL